MRQVETCSSGLQHQPLSKLTAHSSSGAKRDPSPRRHEEPSRRRCDEPPRRDEPHRRSDDPSHNGGGTESDSKQQHGHEHDVKAEAAHLSDSTSAPCPVKDAEKEMLKKQLGEATEKAENMRKAMEKVRTAAVHWKGQHGKLKEEADAAAAAATGRVASLEAELEAACSQGAVAAEQLPAAQEAVKVMEAQVEAAQAAAAASAQAPSSSKLPQSIVAASEASVLARETALEDEDPEQLATPRLLALQEHLEQCKRIAELLARSPKSPKPLLVHWDLQISRRTLVPDVLAQFGQLTTGVAGGKGPLQLWRNTVVTFVNAFGVDEPGIDEGGLTNELHTTFCGTRSSSLSTSSSRAITAATCRAHALPPIPLSSTRRACVALRPRAACCSRASSTTTRRVGCSAVLSSSSLPTRTSGASSCPASRSRRSAR